MNRKVSEEAQVYFIRAGDAGPIKIGIARVPKWRMRDLQVNNHEQLRILATFPGTIRDESSLHRSLKAERTKGEWFRPTERVLALVALYAGTPGKAWESAIDMEPRLARVIEAMAGEDGWYYKFCATETWERKYKPALQQMIGWEPAHHWLRTDRFYTLAHAKAVKVLPPCAPGCKCRDSWIPVSPLTTLDALRSR